MQSEFENETHSLLPALKSAEHDFYCMLLDAIDQAKNDDGQLRKTICEGLRAKVQREGWSRHPPVEILEMRQYLRALDAAIARVEKEAPIPEVEAQSGEENSPPLPAEDTLGPIRKSRPPWPGTKAATAGRAEPLVRAAHEPAQREDAFATERDASFDEDVGSLPVIFSPPNRSRHGLRQASDRGLPVVAPYGEFEDWDDEPVVPTLSRARRYSPIITDSPGKRSVLLPVLRLVGAAALVMALYALFASRFDLGELQKKWRTMFSADEVRSAAANQSLPAVTTFVDATGSVTALPNAYGVFAVSNGKLSELDTLPVRVPDQRVFMSAPITSPSRTTLPNGKVAFIAFRRDLANDAPEKVSIRVVARVMRSLSFDPKGKASYKKLDAQWAVRGNSYEYAVAPLAGRADMVILRPVTDSFVLPAGRYALVLKGQAYDLSIDGPITELVQCLESTEAMNGPIYSECRKL